MKRAAADATEPVMKRVRNGATEPVMTERATDRPVMKRVRNGATEPVMTEREMDRVTDRVMDRVTDRVMELVMQEMQEIKRLIESRVMEPVMQEMQEIKRLIESKQSAPADCNVNPRTSLDQVETSEGRGYQLRFANELPSTIFTDNKIKDKSNESVKIELIDMSKATVTSGPLSSIKIQILVLDGDFGFEAQENWTEKDFNDKVVHEREGKRPLVTGELNIMLRDGVGIISDLSFTDNSSWIRCRKFRLGARVVQSIGGHVRIKEAISEAFVVKDHRTKKYRKHHPPSLDDKVWRLEKIRKDGKFHQRLASHQIDTVKDFMRKYVTDPTKLREMLDCPKGAWDTIVEHASTCDVNDENFFTYSVDGIGLLFNSVYKFVAATFDGQNYQSVDDPTFIDTPLVKSKREQAYRNVSSFLPVDGPAIFGPSKSLPTLQAEPISSSTTGVQHPDKFSVAHQGLAEMQIDCYHATTSSPSTGGLGNHIHQLPLPIPQTFDYNLGMDEFFSPRDDEVVQNIASEMTSTGVVQFYTTQNHFLAVGEDNQIKLWDMDSNYVLTSTEAEGGLAISANSAVSSVSPVNCRVERRSPVRPSPIIVSYSAPRQQAWSLDDLPRTVAVTLHQGSAVISMDFHPSHQTLLLVGSNNGEITLWELGMRDRLVSKPFKIWYMQSCSLPFQASIVKDAPISVSRVAWSPDGNLVGVAFTKHLIQLYSYVGSNDLRQHSEIDAHAGGVNDLAFAHPNKQLCVVTCGDDKLVKVWDLTGRKLFNFEGHDAPSYSIYSHHKENLPFIFSTAIDGKIKAWLYDNLGSRVMYDAPGHWCTTKLYSADGNRLFSCGTSKEGDSFLVEWNESDGTIKRTYVGFRKKSKGVVQFDTTQNHFLAVGEDNQIKFWDMDSNNVLTSTEAEGGLASLPRLRFSKEGNLLAVTTADNGFKILANAAGLRSLRATKNPPFEALRMPIESSTTGQLPHESPGLHQGMHNNYDNASLSHNNSGFFREIGQNPASWPPAAMPTYSPQLPCKDIFQHQNNGYGDPGRTPPQFNGSDSLCIQYSQIRNGLQAQFSAAEQFPQNTVMSPSDFSNELAAIDWESYTK